LQQPVIIERKTVIKEENQQKKTKVNNTELNFMSSSVGNTVSRKKVEPWVPVNVPVREKKVDIEAMNSPQPNNNNKEI